ncbi:MAG TPA: hypothetical protein VNQ79_17085 [Blastocatellia bacterium]|nr:hypothetical protein [Blastocatellia bacterium]
MQPPDYLADYLKLKAANDQLRERAKQWLFETFGRLIAETNRSFSDQPGVAMIQTGFQPREFKADRATMVGEAMAARYRMNTLLVEVGWPRLPEHGFLTGPGLARGRISLSPNPTIDANLIDELILKQRGTEADWHIISNKQIGAMVTEEYLRACLNRVLAD